MQRLEHQFKHYFELDLVEGGKLKIDFVDKHENKTNSIALSALDTLLHSHFTFRQINKDYEIVIKEYDNKRQSYITVSGVANIIIILNFLLNDESREKFCMRPVARLDLEQEKWNSWFFKNLISCMGNKTIPPIRAKKINRILLDCLNKQYELLKNEELVKKLKEVPYEYKGGDLLQHPFYQVLFLLKSDYTIRKQEHDNKSFFDRLGRGVEKDTYDTIFEKYIHFVPDCYCDQIKNETVINEEKIKQSRESSESPKTSRNRNSPDASKINSGEKSTSAIRGTHSAPIVTSSISNISIGLQLPNSSSESSPTPDQENKNPSAISGTKSSPVLMNGFHSKKLPLLPKKEEKKSSLIKSL